MQEIGIMAVHKLMTVQENKNILPPNSKEANTFQYNIHNLVR